MSATATNSQAEGPSPAAGELRPAPGCPGYYVTAAGVVWSEQRNYFKPRGLHTVRAFNGRVRIHVGGKYVWRGVRGLVRMAFGEVAERKDRERRVAGVGG